MEIEPHLRSQLKILYGDQSDQIWQAIQEIIEKGYNDAFVVNIARLK